MSEALDREIPRLLKELDTKEGMRCFRKKLYPGFFEAYRDRIGDVKALILEMYSSENRQEEMQSAALSLVSYAKGIYEGSRRFKKRSVLLDMQCMMVFYLLPSLLSNGDAEADRQFADTVVGVWREVFPSSQISAANYDEIYGGFRNTVLGFNIEGIFGRK